MERTPLRGRFVRVDEAFLREKANNHRDPRNVFYWAMLENDTYEAAVHGIEVSTGNRQMDPTTGRQEILYARRNGWIADESSS